MTFKSFILLMLNQFLKSRIVILFFIPLDKIDYAAWVFHFVGRLVLKIAGDTFRHWKKIDLSTFFGYIPWPIGMTYSKE